MSANGTSDFSVVTELSAHERRVRPSGEIDILTMDRVSEALADAARSDAATVCLDLRGVTFMDSSGIHLAVDAYERCRARLRMIPGAPHVQRVFRLTGTEALLPFA